MCSIIIFFYLYFAYFSSPQHLFLYFKFDLVLLLAPIRMCCTLGRPERRVWMLKSNSHFLQPPLGITSRSHPDRLSLAGWWRNRCLSSVWVWFNWLILILCSFPFGSWGCRQPVYVSQVSGIHLSPFTAAILPLPPNWRSILASTTHITRSLASASPFPRKLS